MDHDQIDALRRHPAWRLLAADTAPLALTVLRRTFVDQPNGPMPEVELVSRVDDALYEVARTHPDRYPRPALQYVRDWAGHDRAWLRAFYLTGSDERHYDVTPAVEKAVKAAAAAAR